MTDLEKLSAPFPPEAVHWRAQSVTKNGDKAMALAYIDARDVMRRLDDALGPDRWQDSYVETATGRVICTISVRCGDEWVSKADGAGSTDIEGEKGGISDAFKRAAVKWGIGRYLYDMPAPWVPCESYQAGGKWKWKKWTADPWKFVRTKQHHEPTPFDAPQFQPPGTPPTDDEALWALSLCKTGEDIDGQVRKFVEMYGSAQRVPAAVKTKVAEMRAEFKKEQAA